MTRACPDCGMKWSPGLIRHYYSCPRRQLSRQERMDRVLGRKHDIQTRSTGVATAAYPHAEADDLEQLHPDCVSNYHAGHLTCARCAWLMGLDTEGARYYDAHLDDEDA